MPLTKKINLQTTDNKELNTGADWALAGNCFDESEIVKNISEGMAFIMDGAYKNCRSLTKVIVPFGITDICEEAFMNCGSLIPDFDHRVCIQLAVFQQIIPTPLEFVGSHILH